MVPMGESEQEEILTSSPVQLTLSSTMGSTPTSKPYSGVASVYEQHRQAVLVPTIDP